MDKQQSRREALAKRLLEVYAERAPMAPKSWPELMDCFRESFMHMADFIIAEQERREGPLVEALESIGYWPKDKSLRLGVDAHDAREALAAYRAIDAPPQRTVEDVLREWNDRAGPLEARAALAVRLLDELAALKRGKE